MTTTLRHTPLYETHVRIGGRMVPFAGWEMPVQYQGILAEARAVRTTAGMFDVSHMGRIIVEGPDARAMLDWVHTADIGEQMAVSRARYGLLCNEEGGIIDDGIVYRLAEERFMLVANAANAPVVLDWLTRWQRERFPNAAIDDQTERVSMIALQGPKAVDIFSRLSGFDPAVVRPFRCAEVTIHVPRGHGASGQGRRALAARTGYTGEDGVEIMPASEDARWLWELLTEHGVVSCGLGARDVLRLEAGLLLHGSDMDTSVTPVEAGLERFVAAKTAFCGSDTIQRQLSNGPPRRLIGFQTVEKGAIPRAHSPLLAEGAVVGQVSSGGYSPTLDRNIGLGYVPVRFTSPGVNIQIDIRGKLVDAVTVALPFYSRPR